MATTLVVTSASARATPPHQLIEGSGSSWAANALNVWIANETSSGLKVVYTATGSATGRRDFGNQTTDFAVTDVGYQGVDPQTGDTDLPCRVGDASDCRAYAYLPYVAGGLSFPYHVEVGGQLLQDLRLSGATLAKIFTGAITNWDDPVITADNHGRRLPDLAIIPVTHSEGSAANSHFTDYLDTRFPGIYRPYEGSAGSTLYFAPPPNGTSQPGSDSVINYVTSTSANGAIGFDDYSYALVKNAPVAKIENAAGYYTLPSAASVSVALRHTAVNADKNSPTYGLAKLAGVYTAPEPTAYPLSAYSYLIIPTAADDSRMNTAKRQTLAEFVHYSVCAGQGQVASIGYAPLPLGLTRLALQGVGLLHAADPDVDLTGLDLAHCTNPTIAAGPPLHDVAAPPAPAVCDADGWGPCGDGPTSVSIGRSSRVGYGRSATISCTLRSGAGPVRDRLSIQQRPAGRAAWHTVTTAATSAAGATRFVVRPSGSAAYRCVNAKSRTTSGTATVGVRKVVTAHAQTAGLRVRIAGSVAPASRGRQVQIQTRSRGRWVALGTTRVGAHGYAYSFRAAREGVLVIRAVCGATPSLLAGTSSALTVRVR